MCARSFAGLLISIVAVSSTAEPHGATSGGPPPATRVDSIVEAARAARKIPGLTLLVEHRGRRVVGRGYGLADVENDVPAGLDTVYPIASLTKQFTSAAVLQLVQQGRLRLDDDVTRLVPGLRVRGGTVTVHHLLSHTHGIPEYNRDETRPEWPTQVGHDRILALINDRELEFAPGTKFSYRNSGYYLLGMIVERVSGTTYGDYLRTRFFEPLGMGRTGQCSTRDIVRKRARGYTLEGGELRNASFLDPSWTFAVGSLCSTAPDLLRWHQALHGGRVLEAGSYARMITPVALSDGSPTDYGYGLGRSVHDGHPLIRHGGNTVGFSSYLTRYPEDDLDVVLLAKRRAGSMGAGRRHHPRLARAAAAPLVS